MWVHGKSIQVPKISPDVPPAELTCAALRILISLSIVVAGSHRGHVLLRATRESLCVVDDQFWATTCGYTAWKRGYVRHGFGQAISRRTVCEEKLLLFSCAVRDGREELAVGGVCISDRLS